MFLCVFKISGFENFHMAELLERFSNPLSKAEQAVKNDCPDKLRDVLKNERTAFTSDLVTEKSLVNHQIRENLLHVCPCTFLA